MADMRFIENEAPDTAERLFALSKELGHTDRGDVVYATASGFRVHDDVAEAFWNPKAEEHHTRRKTHRKPVNKEAPSGD